MLFALLLALVPRPARAGGLQGHSRPTRRAPGGGVGPPAGVVAVWHAAEGGASADDLIGLVVHWGGFTDFFHPEHHNLFSAIIHYQIMLIMQSLNSELC